MSDGFVYLLDNPAMPYYYKIGKTKHAPARRAAELSASPGVPERFRVVCFISAERYGDIELWLHNYLADFRPNFTREFFQFRDEHIPWVIGLMKWHPEAKSFWKRGASFLPDSAELVNSWVGAVHGVPTMTSICPVAFIDAEPV